MTEPDSASAAERRSRTQRILRSPIIVVATVLALILDVIIGLIIVKKPSSGRPVASMAVASMAGAQHGGRVATGGVSGDDGHDRGSYRPAASSLAVPTAANPLGRHPVTPSVVAPGGLAWR